MHSQGLSCDVHLFWDNIVYTYTIVSKFHETVDCIKTKLKIVTSMQFKLCTASWLEGGHSVQKCLQGCAANMGCKIKMVRFVGSLFFAKFGTKNHRICAKRV